jgi:hypothetical protein
VLGLARVDALSDATSCLQMSTFEAAAVLRELATDPSTHSHVRLAACRSILEHAYKASDLEDIELEIERLEPDLGGELMRRYSSDLKSIRDQVPPPSPPDEDTSCDPDDPARLFAMKTMWESPSVSRARERSSGGFVRVTLDHHQSSG